MIRSGTLNIENLYIDQTLLFLAVAKAVASGRGLDPRVARQRTRVGSGPDTRIQERITGGVGAHAHGACLLAVARALRVDEVGSFSVLVRNAGGAGVTESVNACSGSQEIVELVGVVESRLGYASRRLSVECGGFLSFLL